MDCNTIFITVIVLIILAFIYLYKFKNTEYMSSDGGALIQLNAKGPMDNYLIGNAGDYYPYYYGVRPKRSYRTMPYWYPYYRSNWNNPY